MKVARDTLLGLVFFAGLAVLIAATIFLSELAYGRTQTIAVLFPTGFGLKAGDPVQVAGVKKGYVDALDITQTGPINRRVLARLEVAREVKLHQGTKFTIELLSLLGGRVVSVDPGSYEAPELTVDPRIPFEGQIAVDPIKAFGDLISEVRPGVSEAIASFNATFKAASTGTGTLAMLLNDTQTRDDVKTSVSNIRALTDTVARGEGTLGRLFKDDTIAKRLEDVLAKIDKGDGPIPQLLNNKEWSAKLERTLSNVDEISTKLNRGEGSLGKLINTSDAHDRLLKIEEQLSEALDKLNKGDGLLAVLLNDKQLGQDFKGAARSLRDLLAGLDRGEGTLGKLLKDDQLVRNLERLVRQLSRSVEDAREAAPIAIFSAVLFGAF